LEAQITNAVARDIIITTTTAAIKMTMELMASSGKMDGLS
jgi:hypothetical protein